MLFVYSVFIGGVALGLFIMGLYSRREIVHLKESRDFWLKEVIANREGSHEQRSGPQEEDGGGSD
jgi:hypothetical protein